MSDTTLTAIAVLGLGCIACGYAMAKLESWETDAHHRRVKKILDRLNNAGR